MPKDAIGGYFELELNQCFQNMPHKDGVMLNSGRHSLEYILSGLPCINKIYIPYLTCDVILHPLTRLGISCQFYSVNENLEIAEKISLKENEYILYTNYYGVKDSYIDVLEAEFGNKLIVDNAQALFAEARPLCHQFYSPRKFVGVPDGGIVVSSLVNFRADLPLDESFDRCSHLLKRYDKIPFDGYSDFKENSRKIDGAVLSRMSKLTCALLNSVDFSIIQAKRQENFAFLHNNLAQTNLFRIPHLTSFQCPLVYPYWSNTSGLKEFLIKNNIFVATYWPNVFDWVDENHLEYSISKNVICIPVDQRYSSMDMDYIVKKIHQFY